MSRGRPLRRCGLVLTLSAGLLAHGPRAARASGQGNGQSDSSHGGSSNGSGDSSNSSKSSSDNSGASSKDSHASTQNSPKNTTDYSSRGTADWSTHSRGGQVFSIA